MIILRKEHKIVTGNLLKSPFSLPFSNAVHSLCPRFRFLVSDHFPEKEKKKMQQALQKLATLSALPSPRIEAHGRTQVPPPGYFSTAADRRRSVAAKANRELSLSSWMATSFERSDGVKIGAEAGKF